MTARTVGVFINRLENNEPLCLFHYTRTLVIDICIHIYVHDIGITYRNTRVGSRTHECVRRAVMDTVYNNNYSLNRILITHEYNIIHMCCWRVSCTRREITVNGSESSRKLRRKIILKTCLGTTTRRPSTRS